MQQWAQRGVQAALVTGGLWMLGTGLASAEEPDVTLPAVDDLASSAVDEATLPTLTDSEDTDVKATLPRELSDGLEPPKDLAEAGLPDLPELDPSAVADQLPAREHLEQAAGRVTRATEHLAQAAPRSADNHIIPFVGPLDALLSAGNAVAPEDIEPLALDASEHLLPATAVPALPTANTFPTVAPRSDMPELDLLQDTVMLPSVGQLDLASLPEAELPEAGLPEADLPTTELHRIPGLSDAVEAVQAHAQLPEVPVEAAQLSAVPMERDLPTTEFDRIPGVTDAAEAFRDNLQVPQLDTVTAPMDRDLPTTEFGMLPGVEEVVGAFQGAGVPNLPHTGSLSGNLPLEDLLAAQQHVGELPMAADYTELVDGRRLV
ncbi:hypothetical protein [Thermocrispum municipale]|uniref:hypothetical protein n=1 Tax=Thermocrispum municipale TaxID=37926 RepID=UPI00040D36C5|nr:hypothetical protein [Thermocrispum municipale]